MDLPFPEVYLRAIAKAQSVEYHRRRKFFVFNAGIRKLLKTRATCSQPSPQWPIQTASRMPLERAELPLGRVRTTGTAPKVIRGKKVA